MTTRPVRALVLFACLVPALVPASAAACWDGVSASTSKVELAIESSATWTPEQARHWAKWIARIDALVPDGKSLRVLHGDLEVCDADGEGCQAIDGAWIDGRAFTLFERAADLFAASGSTIAAARHLDRAPLTVQVAASHDFAAAERLAARIDAAELSLAGFLVIGGFPSVNADAHVVESSADDRFVYHVVVGAYLDRDEAEAARATLEGELGLHGFVRPLDQSAITDEGC